MATEREPRETGTELQEISVWSRRYAQNRTVPLLVFLLVFAVVNGALLGFSYLVCWFFREHCVWALPAVALLVLALALCIWSWYRHIWRFIQQMSDWVYGTEGMASVRARTPHHRSDLLVSLAFAACVTASVGLGLTGMLPLHYIQPISALYVVPFLLYWYARVRGAMSPFALLWPALYTLHAVLLLLGAPIHFSGWLEELNMFLPTMGYGLIAALAGHIYSRYVLRKLRRLATVVTEEAEN